MRVHLLAAALIAGTGSPCRAWEHRYLTAASDAALVLRSDGDVIVGRCAPAANGSERASSPDSTK
jgi:hypothetical protein